MRKISAKIGVTALSALALFAFSISQASADVEEVDCDDGGSIQEALDEAEDGDVIEVEGACVENVTVRGFKITLRGLPGASITADDVTKSVILVRGIDARIEDFDLIKDGRNGVAVTRASSAVIQDNHIEDATDHGIVVNRSSFARIEGNMVHNSTKIGIKIMKSSSADIVDNTVTGLDKGIQVNLGSSADLEDNTITGNGGDGLRVQDTSAIRLLSPANLIELNTGAGVKCIQNSSIRIQTAPNFGAGNTPNTSIAGSCTVAGSF